MCEVPGTAAGNMIGWLVVWVQSQHATGRQGKKSLCPRRIFQPSNLAGAHGRGLPADTARAVSGPQSARHDFLAPPSPDLPAPSLDLFECRHRRCFEPRRNAVVWRRRFLFGANAAFLAVVVIGATERSITSRADFHDGFLQATYRTVPRGIRLVGELNEN